MQTRRESLIESMADIGVGFFISICATFVINYIHGIDIPIWKNFTMTICFTFISLFRRYATRRYFNSKETKYEN